MRRVLTRGFSGSTSLAASTATGAILAVMALVPQPALAQEAQGQEASAQEASAESSHGDIVVTANRREQLVEDVPASLVVLTPEQLGRSGINDLQSLASRIAGLSIFDFGARSAAATNPNIRGINADAQPGRSFRAFTQGPVGTYIGNSPIEGYIQLTDVERVEVLRGPQGTLYGAGALSGAMRILPNSPALGEVQASGDVSAGIVSHAGKLAHGAEGMVNLPLGDLAAVRLSAKYDYAPGFINVHGVLKTEGSGITATPVLADPSDPVNSSPIYEDKPDFNFQRALTTRAALRWEPVADFFAEAAYTRSRVSGEGGRQVNLDYPGGPHPFDSNATLPSGGRFEAYSAGEEPFWRTTHLGSLDLSYNAGFATLSSTTSYQTTSGETYGDNTYGIAGTAGGFYLPYYAGIPTNPRFLYRYLFSDKARSFSQEVRLVSNPGEAGDFDYTIGLFYQNQKREGDWTIPVPGSRERSIAQGCTDPVFAGSTFPDCLVVTGPDGVVFEQVDTQRFTDKSIFGEVIWHFADRAQLIVGGRHFRQDFTTAQSYLDYPFPIDIPAVPNQSKTSKTIGKASVSFEFTNRHNVYALWSQGFRRGGANAIPPEGIFREPDELRLYEPDTSNNFELGVKGRFFGGPSYALSGFYIDWSNPQISASLPSGNLAVYNAKSAVSKGFEFQSNGPLIAGFSYNFGVAYSNAKMTADYSLPANNGSGVIVPDLITGRDGSRLPGSPKWSGNASLDYTHDLSDDLVLSLSVTGIYRSPMVLSIPGGASGVQTEEHRLVNLLGSMSTENWRASVYVNNLFDKQTILSLPGGTRYFNNLTGAYTVNRPREMGLRLGYTF